jgi:hypothetical protein
MNKMPIQKLAALLQNVPAGLVPDGISAAVLNALADCWTEFRGSTDTKMEFWKVVRDGGPKDLTWNQPILSFTIERHGAMVLGSSRAAKQHWLVDIAEKSADSETIGYRQLYPSARRVDVKAIATSICEDVQKGPDSGSTLISRGILIWKTNNEIEIKHGKLIPNNGYMQTISGRRQRFRADLKIKMGTIGWSLVKEGRSLSYKKG